MWPFALLPSAQPSFLVTVPTSPAPALRPACSACSSWALAGQGKAGADQKCLRGSCVSQLPFSCCLWLPNGQAREDKARLFLGVFSGRSGGNGHKLQHEKFWPSKRKNSLTMKVVKDLTRSPRLVDPPPLKIFKPQLHVALGQPDLTRCDLSRGWTGWPPGVPSNLHYSIMLQPGDKLLFRGALADQYDLTCLRQKFPTWVRLCLNIKWNSFGLLGFFRWKLSSYLGKCNHTVIHSACAGLPSKVPETL